MDIVSALFSENIDLRPAPGPSTRIDLTGIMFSMAAASDPPVTITPHLVVLIRCRPDEDGEGILEVTFRDEQGEQVARNVSPFNVEPGKFTYRLVRGGAGGADAPRRSGCGSPPAAPWTGSTSRAGRRCCPSSPRPSSCSPTRSASR